jgi:3-oxoacyl-[acyl-carrier protein] reductase
VGAVPYAQAADSGPGARAALVTGANRGTGLAIARRLEGAGMSVWQLNRTVSAAGRRQIQCDLSDPGAVRRSVQHAIDEAGGRLDVFVANAVERYFSPIADAESSRWSHALAVNLGSIVEALRTALPALRAAHGTVVLMGSHAGSRFFEGGACYCASKAALKAVCEVMLLEERRNGVRTCLVSPGAIANQDGDPGLFKMATDSVAGLVEYLALAPADVAVGEVELRPSALPPQTVTGIDRLQAV